MKLKAIMLAILLLALLASPVLAQESEIDFTDFAGMELMCSMFVIIVVIVGGVIVLYALVPKNE